MCSQLAASHKLIHGLRGVGAQIMYVVANMNEHQNLDDPWRDAMICAVDITYIVTQPIKMEQIEDSETSLNNNQTLGKYPKNTY